MRGSNQSIDQPKVTGFSLDEWVMMTANLTLQGKFNGLHKDGSFFIREETIDLPSLDVLEYVKNKSHTHNTGGGLVVETNDVIQEFYSDSNIESIYGHVEGNEINLFLVLREEVDQLALRLAKLQNKISRQHPNCNIEIAYTPKEYFKDDYVPDGAVMYRRR